MRTGLALSALIGVEDHEPGAVRIPVWVRRMHADGLPFAVDELPSKDVAWRFPPPTGSQEYLKRWNRVTSGY